MLTDEIAYERKTIPQAWSEQQKADLLRMREVEGRDWSEIAGAMKRSEAAVKSKYKYEQVQRDAKSNASSSESLLSVPEEVLAEKARRIAEQAQRSITAAIFGDPVFSRSALAKKSGGVMV